MVNIHTSNLRIAKPGRNDRDWDVPINIALDTLDAQSAIGSLAVTTLDSPGQSLSIRVCPGSYVRSDGTIASIEGELSTTLPAAANVMVWLNDLGSIHFGTGFPLSSHLRLAHVVTNANTITGITDKRIYSTVVGQQVSYMLKSGDTMNGSFSVASPLTHQSILVVSATDQTIGFFGAPPNGQSPAMTPLQLDANAVGGDAITNLGGSYSQDAINANFTNVSTRINGLIAALKRNGLMLN